MCPKFNPIKVHVSETFALTMAPFGTSYDILAHYLMFVYELTKLSVIFIPYLKGLVWFGLCCLMTPGLSKDIRCHV